jgi:hypothetical protein
VSNERNKLSALAISEELALTVDFEIVFEAAQAELEALERILTLKMDRAEQLLADPWIDQRIKDAAQDFLGTAKSIINPQVKPVVFSSNAFNEILDYAFNEIFDYNLEASVQPHQLFRMRKAMSVFQYGM